MALFVISVVLFYLLLGIYSSADLLRTTMGSLLSLKYMAAYLLLFITAILLKHLRWAIFLNSVNVDVGFFNALKIYLAGLSLCVTPARIGDFIKSILMKDKFATKHSEIVPVIFMERVTDVLALGSLILIGISVIFGEMHHFLLLMLFWIIVTVLLKHELLIDSMLRFFLRPFKRKFKIGIGVVHENLMKLSKPKVLLSGTVLDVFAWFMESTIFYLIVISAGYHLSIWNSVLIVSAGILLGSISMIPAAIGIFEVGAIGALSFWGLPTSEAGAIILMYRALTLWMSTFIGLMSLAYLMKNHR